MKGARGSAYATPAATVLIATALLCCIAVFLVWAGVAGYFLESPRFSHGGLSDLARRDATNGCTVQCITGCANEKSQRIYQMRKAVAAEAQIDARYGAITTARQYSRQLDEEPAQRNYVVAPLSGLHNPNLGPAVPIAPPATESMDVINQNPTRFIIRKLGTDRARDPPPGADLIH